MSFKNPLGDISKVTSLKVEGTYLRKDVDYLKSTDFSSLFEAVETEGALVAVEIPPTTSGDATMEDIETEASEIQTDKEMFGNMMLWCMMIS